MSYGIEIKNANDNVVIDSETSNTGFVIIDAGTSNSITSINLEEEFLFVKPNATSGNYNIALHRTSGNFGENQAITFRENSGSAISCDCVRGKFANTLTVSSGGYGLQIFNSEGDLAFDSGLYGGDGGFGITNYFPNQSMNGAHNLMDTDTSKYVLGNTLFGTSANSGFWIGVHYINSHTTTTQASANGIYFNGYFTFSFMGGGGGQTPVNNIGAQFLGEGGSV